MSGTPPPFKVIDPSPSFGKCVANLNVTDIMTIGGVTTFGFVSGHFKGKSSSWTLTNVFNNRKQPRL